eukprot:1147499-Pelagomonas_calceolata.AAC.16
MAIKHQLQTTVIQQAISGQYEKSKGQFHRKGNSCNKACTQTYFDVPIPQSLLHLLADFCCLVCHDFSSGRWSPQHTSILPVKVIRATATWRFVECN